jgi:hypothetical protein
VRRLLLASLAVSAAVLMPSAARAQRAFVGLSAGVDHISQRDYDASAVRPSVGARVGVGVARGVSLVLDAQAHGLGDEDPQPSDFQGDDFVNLPEVLQTTTLLLGAQIDVARGAYVRPAIGVGRHAFPSYLVQGNDAVSAEVSHEAGLAAGVSAGYLLRAGTSFSLAIEASATWSGGEDSSGDRTIFGIKLVPLLGL